MMIVHRIVRDHGGGVGIDSKQDAGTIVTLHFPRKSPRHRLLESNELKEKTRPLKPIYLSSTMSSIPAKLGRPEDKFGFWHQPEEAFNAIEAEKFEVVLTDLRMSRLGMSVIDFSINTQLLPLHLDDRLWRGGRGRGGNEKALLIFSPNQST